jgi:uncharacterized protein YndB with AHSA1/START domain
MNTNILRLTHAPVATAEMLIRKPAADVFEAFVNPDLTTKFWFTKSSGRLAPGAQVTWTWEMYTASAQVSVLAVEENKRILIEWSGYDSPTTVEWTLIQHGDGATFVTITNAGFSGDGDEVVRQALDAKGGFTWVLAGLKAFLEQGIELNLIADAFPSHAAAPANGGAEAE